MQLAGYKIKCMLAEPKSKGHREAQPSAELHTAHLYQVSATCLMVTKELPLDNISLPIPKALLLGVAPDTSRLSSQEPRAC